MGEREKTTCTVTVVFNCIPMSDQRSLRQRFINLRLGISLSVQHSTILRCCLGYCTASPATNSTSRLLS